MREYAAIIIPIRRIKSKPRTRITLWFRLTFMRGIVTLFDMEQQMKTMTQTLPCGRKLTITLDRAAARDANERGEVAVYDDRFTENPSFQILDSYRIRKNTIKREIIRAMIAYNEAHPSDPAWQRTERALLVEWLEHNFAYRVGFLRSRAASVDLDNPAEGKGALGYFINSAWEVILGYLKPKKN